MRFLASALLATTLDEMAGTRGRPVGKRNVVRHREARRWAERS